MKVVVLLLMAILGITWAVGHVAVVTERVANEHRARLHENQK